MLRGQDDVERIRGGGWGRVGIRIGNTDQLFMIDPAQHEEQFGGMVEPGPHSVKHRRHMLAHAGPVRAIAVECHLAGQGEETLFAIRRHLHDAPVQLAAQRW